MIILAVVAGRSVIYPCWHSKLLGVDPKHIYAKMVY